jgi:predicted aspartyl protease
MTFQLLCKSIESRTGNELASARSPEEKALILTSALYEYRDSVLKGLHTLLLEAGAASARYQQAQTAATDLLIFLALPFISSCSTYRQGVNVLEELGEICSDEALRRRLVIYANQIKRRWFKTDPTGLPTNPRAAKIRREKPKPQFFATGLRLTLLSVAALYFLTRIDLTSVVFPYWHLARHAPAPQEAVAVPENQNAPPQPPSDAVQQSPPAAGEFFSYTDAKGVIHLGNNPENATGQGVTVSRSAAAQSDLTPVVIKGNQVLVPVTLSYRGRSSQSMLLLDTGASVTTINERFAAQLGVGPSDTRPETSTVADGRRVSSCSFVADTLAVGPKSLPQHRTSIMPGSGGAGYDGLLGMDFLKNLRYHVDFSRNVIEWNSR